MTRVAFLGAGSTIFAKNVLGDCILTPEIPDLSISLHDIDPIRLDDSKRMIENIARNAGRSVAISASLDRKAALAGADFVVNAIQVGGYDPCSITDFAVPRKYGLRQTIADTLGIGGIFRTLRTLPVLEDFVHDIEAVCPDALFINYTNPMAMLSGYLQRFSGVRTVGLCHSVQACAPGLLRTLGMDEHIDTCRWKIAGINHQAWLLEIADKGGSDLYPEIKRRERIYRQDMPPVPWRHDTVRHEMMRRFGYYLTESSEHTAEYVPYFIKSKYPELIERFEIPLDDYPVRCINQIEWWRTMREGLVENRALTHEKTHEFASYIISAVTTDKPFRVHGNVLNTGLIPNLPANACVEVPCLVDRNGISPCFVGDLPEQCAALNRTNINVQLLTLEANARRKREWVYMAAMLDPHTAAELSLDDIVAMCDEMFEAHGSWIPAYE